MEEFIFGTLATDDLKLIHHRALSLGVQHAYELDPRDPGAGQPVTLRVRVGPDRHVEHVACYYTLDGSEPAGSRGVAQSGQVVRFDRVDTRWDVFVWGYISLWQATLPPQLEGTAVRYRIGAWGGDGPEVFADWPDVKATNEEAAKAFFHKQPLPQTMAGDPSVGNTFLFHVDSLAPPDWAREAIIYQIFVDRFYPGKGRDWLQTGDLRQFFGGTLWGVVEKLDYIAGLGADCIWLSPVFPSPTTHGYDATDFEQVEPRMGGDEALKALVDEAHGRGIRVILDLACNHVSNLCPMFQDALKNPRSPYREWFRFDDSEVGYRAFFGVPSMPEVNLAHPDARQWMTDIGRYWLSEFDVDGYRLDHASGPGPSFWPDFWAACKAQKSDSLCFGEVVEPPYLQRRFVGRMDGLLDFHLADALRRTFARRVWSEDQFNQFLADHLSYFPADFLMLSFLDNHDMDRFHFLGGEEAKALKKAAQIQMRLPGPPVIYYGTEVGMSQTVSKTSSVGLEASRMAMAWNHHQSHSLLDYYRQIIRERRDAKPWLTPGQLRPERSSSRS